MTMDADAEMQNGAIGGGGGGEVASLACDLESPADESLSMLHEDSETIVRHFNWDRVSHFREISSVDFYSAKGFEKENDSAVDLSSSAIPPVKTLPIVFRWNRDGQAISISGSYDNWKSKMPLVKSQEDFYTVVEVPEGTHQYKFLVDGEWRCHPNEPMIDNSIGSQNNIMTIKESDCDLCQILCDNSIGTEGSTNGGEFSQYIPPKQASYCFMRSGPPAVPPQLLDTILDKEVPAYCEPTLVVEPTHVVLNHLYTLSIKDGVMVMSTTHRYRKKYITTLLYRPIIKG